MRGITKAYGTGSMRVPALRGVDLEVNRGEFCAIMGRSGSGKSTLLRIIGTLERMDAGEYYLQGTDVGSLRERERCYLRRNDIGIVFQKYELLPEYTVWDNICLPLYLDRQEPDLEYLDEILYQFGIADKKSTYPDQLSGGQQQRVAIARAMAHKPEILLADEPTGNLDHRTGMEVMETLVRARELTGQTIILVTHDNESASHADRILQMEDGILRE